MKNAGMIIALAFVGFVIVLAVVIGNRLDEQAVALLAGTACGVGLATPLGVAIGWYVQSRRSVERAAPSQPMMIVTPPQPQQPMVAGYMNAPVNPAWSGAYPIGQGTPMIAPRQFTIVGEEPLSHESDSIW